MIEATKELMHGAQRLRMQEYHMLTRTNLHADAYMVPLRVVQDAGYTVQEGEDIQLFGMPVILTDGEWGLFYEVKP